MSQLKRIPSIHDTQLKASCDLCDAYDVRFVGSMRSKIGIIHPPGKGRPAPGKGRPVPPGRQTAPRPAKGAPPPPHWQKAPHSAMSMIPQHISASSIIFYICSRYEVFRNCRYNFLNNCIGCPKLIRCSASNLAQQCGSVGRFF